MKKSMRSHAKKVSIKLGKVLHVLATAIRRSEARRATQLHSQATAKRSASRAPTLRPAQARRSTT